MVPRVLIACELSGTVAKAMADQWGRAALQQIRNAA